MAHSVILFNKFLHNCSSCELCALNENILMAELLVVVLHYLNKIITIETFVMKNKKRTEKKVNLIKSLMRNNKLKQLCRTEA